MHNPTTSIQQASRLPQRCRADRSSVRSGDAKLVDHPGTALGQIYSYLTNAPASRAVRYRRKRLAQLIDVVQHRDRGLVSTEPRVISLAAGHLREIELTAGYQNGLANGKIIALDQDTESLGVIAREYAKFGAVPLRANAKEIVTRKVPLVGSELIYAAGLFDYLPDSFARLLVGTMFESLNQEGCLLLVNFLPNIRDCGFMEAVMDWWLIYRTEK
jgi:extracellular factor (EF) 3-hydroxypalmitic acid methyl ester biosynthesis protein